MKPTFLRSHAWLAGVVVFTYALVVGVEPAAAQGAGAAPLPGVGNPCPLPDGVQPGGGGGANNIVIVRNPTGGDLRVRGSVQLNHVPGPTVGSVNCAAALNGTSGQLDPTLMQVACIGCQSLAVALQIDLRSNTATRVTPRNVANAQNSQCDRCAAVAIAIQAVIPVDDPNGPLPADADAMARNLDQQLRALQTDHTLTAAQAADHVISVVDQFRALVAGLDVQRSDAI
jgi:hypothetical protein